jgi:hypothetical protein
MAVIPDAHNLVKRSENTIAPDSVTLPVERVPLFGVPTRIASASGHLKF